MSEDDLTTEVQNAFKVVADNIKIARAARKLTQADVAGAIGINRMSYVAAEAGDTSLSSLIYGKIIAYFGLSFTIRMLGAPSLDQIGQELRSAQKTKIKSKK